MYTVEGLVNLLDQSIASSQKSKKSKADECMMIDTTQMQIVKEEYKQENIDLEYTSDAVIVQTESQEDFEYKLVGVVLHMGTADAGHYLSYININRGEKNE